MAFDPTAAADEIIDTKNAQPTSMFEFEPVRTWLMDLCKKKIEVGTSLSWADITAIISRGATETLKDKSAVKGFNEREVKNLKRWVTKPCNDRNITEFIKRNYPELHLEIKRGQSS